MEAVVGIVLPVFGLVALGYGASWIGFNKPVGGSAAGVGTAIGLSAGTTTRTSLFQS